MLMFITTHNIRSSFVVPTPGWRKWLPCPHSPQKSFAGVAVRGGGHFLTWVYYDGGPGVITCRYGNHIPPYGIYITEEHLSLYIQYWNKSANLMASYYFICIFFWYCEWSKWTARTIWCSGTGVIVPEIDPEQTQLELNSSATPSQINWI